MRIENLKLLRIELDRREAIALRRVLEVAAPLMPNYDEEGERFRCDLRDGLVQTIYDTRQEGT